MTEENNPEAAAGSEEQKPQVQFATQRIFVKDLSFEAPNNIVPTGNWKPKISQDLNTSVNRVAEEVYEVVLNLTVTVTVDEDKTAFLVEVHQAGLFAVKGLEGANLQHLLSSQCPNILFPYAREAVDNLVTRGGFPPLMLPPINFDALYAQALAEAKRQQDQGGQSEAH